MNESAANPGVIMLMSVDLSGSTEFKSRAQGEGESPAWLEAFEAFFREVPLILMGQIAAAFGVEDEIPDAGVWKVIGDEIIFLARPRNIKEAQLLTVAFYRSVISYDKKISERWPLRVKGCCWAANVSVRNREVEIPEMLGASTDQVYVDYLGPDVDTGFRLTSVVGRGQVIAAANLVHALAEMKDTQRIQFHYIGSRVLKGVYCGRPYPLFLMSMPELMPECWEWEVEHDPGLLELSRNEPMPAEEILDLLDRIQSYLNRMYHAGIEKLEF
jgi:hypothetical protein